MKFFKDIYKFLRKNNLSLDFNLHNGFFICPISMTNQANQYNRPMFLLKKTTLLEIYEKNDPKLVEAVKYFIEANGVKFNPLDDPTFYLYFVVLAYFIAFYKRRMDFANVKSIGYEWKDIKDHFTKHTVKKMYKSLLHYLMYEKGLTKKTSRDILYYCNPKDDQGLVNIFSLLNSFEKMYHPETKSSSKLLKKQLVYDLEAIKSRNPLDKIGGTDMEKASRKEMDRIKKGLLTIFRATKCLVLDFDDNFQKKFIKMKRKIRTPDFLYLDNLGNMLALDAKLSINVNVSDLTQISKTNLAKALNAIKFKENLEAIAKSKNQSFP